ncbi:Dipeptidyl anminopeptidase [Labilithrix luteola]|uniref:Dipeptidyl anminopeptidase n=1 Tax=Labilithrix luteola TaxID=1391654 RepID=A0A0K1PRK5_9BACT|nr:S9 family peptidase [Labilithrix luteola]AKU96180.1 Dipeptidyl anminopeptidase [Labilithrix luteola]
MRRVLLSLLLAAFSFSCGGSSSAPQATAPKHQSMLAAMASGTKDSAPPKKDPPRADASLLARDVLFGNPDRAMPLVSPDGKHLSYLSSSDGVLNVWVAAIDARDKAKVVTQDKKRGIRTYRWAFTNNHVLYLQDNDGDENFHLHAVDIRTGKDQDLTPFEGVQARIEALSHKIPGEVLVGINDRDKRFHDVYRVNVVTGKRTLVQKNEGFASFSTDDDFKVRFGMKPEKDGSTEMLEADGKGGFRPYGRIPMEDALTTFVAGFDKEGKKAFLIDSRGRNTAAFVELDVASKKSKVLLDDGQADVEALVRHPTTGKVQAAVSTYDRFRWHVIDQSIRADLDAIAQVAPGDIELESRSLDDTKWLVGSYVSDAPVKYYLYDRTKKKAELLFSNFKALEDAKLAPTRPVILKSRDGLDLVSYLTLPRDAKAEQPLPMVLFVHGGPWARDAFGLNRWHQWLASRGYAVLSVNYRGSTGFGKSFINAADHEWAGKMHDDLVDAVTWAVSSKIADKDKVAIMGGSYGGYASLVGLTFTPDTFACGVDIVGPSNLTTLLSSIPPYWESEVEQFSKRIGDHRTEDGKKFLASRSPISFVDRIKRPLLIGQGANDPRVKQAESDQIVTAMQKKGIPVTYVLYPDEGHGFARPQNRTSFNAVAEVFLAQCLGGPYEPIGKDFEGSTITVPIGKDQIHTLSSTLK